MSKLSLWKIICFVCVLCAVEAIGAPAQTFKTLVSFNGTDGANPITELSQGINGSFYGTTRYGGSNCVNSGGCGTVFTITPAGALTMPYNFGTDGAGPEGELVQATDGKLYGTTLGGGRGNALGTVFKITPGGKLTTLYSFCPSECTDGSDPEGGVMQAIDGNFYGTTAFGGNLTCNSGCGTSLQNHRRRHIDHTLQVLLKKELC
jgi:uncharacterized repeat protein (TIGR03803 family)